MPFLSYILAGILIALPLATPAQTVIHRLEKGITLQQTTLVGRHPLLYTLLRINLHTRGVHVICGLAHRRITTSGAWKGREPVTEIAEENLALAGINANFFPFTGQPIGLAIRNGRLITPPDGVRPSFGIAENLPAIETLRWQGVLYLPTHATLPLQNLNNTPAAAGITLITPDYAAEPVLKFAYTLLIIQKTNLPLRPSRILKGKLASITQMPAGSQLPQCPAHGIELAAAGPQASQLLSLHPGTTLRVQCSLYPASKPHSRPIWRHVTQAVSGGPWLLHKGDLHEDGVAEGFSKVYFVNFMHPRTAVGITKHRNLIMLVVDGRSPLSTGISLDNLAKLMKKLGATEAMNLDGGGSSTLVLENGVLNFPSDGIERPVSTALLVDAMPLKHATAFTILAPSTTFPAGSHTYVKAVDANGKQLRPVWSTKTGVGFVDQLGTVSCYQPGIVRIQALLGQTAAQTTLRASQPKIKTGETNKDNANSK